MSDVVPAKKKRPATHAAVDVIVPQLGNGGNINPPPTHSKPPAPLPPPDLSPPDSVPRNLPRHRTEWQGGKYPGSSKAPFPQPPHGATHPVVRSLHNAARTTLPPNAVISLVESISTLHQPAYVARYKADLLEWLQLPK